jgi:hypothetical protein
MVIALMIMNLQGMNPVNGAAERTGLSTNIYGRFIIISAMTI